MRRTSTDANSEKKRSTRLGVRLCARALENTPPHRRDRTPRRPRSRPQRTHAPNRATSARVNSITRASPSDRKTRRISRAPAPCRGVMENAVTTRRDRTMRRRTGAPRHPQLERQRGKALELESPLHSRDAASVRSMLRPARRPAELDEVRAEPTPTSKKLAPRQRAELPNPGTNARAQTPTLHWAKNSGGRAGRRRLRATRVVSQKSRTWSFSVSLPCDLGQHLLEPLACTTRSRVSRERPPVTSHLGSLIGMSAEPTHRSASACGFSGGTTTPRAQSPRARGLAGGCEQHRPPTAMKSISFAGRISGRSGAPRASRAKHRCRRESG